MARADLQAPELPPLRPERGAELSERFMTAAEGSGAVVHRNVDPEALVAGREPGDVGISHAAYGLADTGSVVLRSGPTQSRRESLLPAVHVCVVPVERLLPGLPELFAEVGVDLPSELAIVTGPSRSADIEQNLTIGVHGPGEVHVVLVDREP